MIAGRICFQAGVLDVEEWLTREESTRILDWWEAYERVNPLPDSWVQTATICRSIAELRASVMATVGVTTKAEDIASWQSFMPERYRAEKPSTEPIQSPEQQRKVVEKWASQ